MSRVINALNGVTLIITLLKTNLLSPLPLQVDHYSLTPRIEALAVPLNETPKGTFNWAFK